MNLDQFLTDIVTLNMAQDEFPTVVNLNLFQDDDGWRFLHTPLRSDA